MGSQDGQVVGQAHQGLYNGKTIEREKKIQWPEYTVLKKMTDASGFSETGRRLGVSDNAIRKHMKRMPG